MTSRIFNVKFFFNVKGKNHDTMLVNISTIKIRVTRSFVCECNLFIDIGHSLLKEATTLSYK